MLIAALVHNVLHVCLAKVIMDEAWKAAATALHLQALCAGVDGTDGGTDECGATSCSVMNQGSVCLLDEDWDPTIPQQNVTRRTCQAVVAVYGSSTRY